LDVYSRSGQRRELWYTRAISIFMPRIRWIGDDIGRFAILRLRIRAFRDPSRRPELDAD